MTEHDSFKIGIIGKKIEVVDASNKSLIGKKGKVTMETKNMIILEDGTSLVKNQIIVNITDSQLSNIKGKSLIGTPEERLKKQRGKK